MKQHLILVASSNRDDYEEEVNELIEEGYLIKSTNIANREVGSYDEWSQYQAIMIKDTKSEMFEIGKEYCINRNVNGELKSYYCIVKEYGNKNGLLKIDCRGKEEIINVNSPDFIGAELVQTDEHVKINFSFNEMTDEELEKFTQ